MKLVIFDLDGVIVSTDSLHFKAWSELAEKYNLTFNEDINSFLRGVSRAESLQIILNKNNKSVDDSTFEMMLEEKNEVYKSHLNEIDENWILAGVLKLLDELKENGIKIAIGSSSKNTPTILSKIGLSGIWDTIVDGNDIKNSKPDPEVFMKGADRLGLDYKDCVVFEDAQAGVDAALAAQMSVIGVGHEPLQNTNHHVKTLDQINVEKLFELVG